MFSLIWQLILSVGFLSVLYWILRGVGRELVAEAFARSIGRNEHVYTALYPVFTEREVRSANESAVEASKELAQRQASLLNAPEFAEATRSRQFSSMVASEMLTVCSVEIAAEERWFRHAVLMDANISVVCGKRSRDEALTNAMVQLNQTSTPTLVSDAMQLRDEWQQRIVHGGDPFPAEARRRYSNVWSDRASSYFYHWSSVSV